MHPPRVPRRAARVFCSTKKSCIMTGCTKRFFGFSESLQEGTQRMQYSAVVFDLDGTLLDTLADIAEAANRVLVNHGLAAHELDSYRQFVGEGVRVLFERSLPPEACTSERLDACADDFRRVMPSAGISGLIPTTESKPCCPRWWRTTCVSRCCRTNRTCSPRPVSASTFRTSRSRPYWASGRASAQARSGRGLGNRRRHGPGPGPIPVRRRHGRGYANRDCRRHVSGRGSMGISAFAGIACGRCPSGDRASGGVVAVVPAGIGRQPGTSISSTGTIASSRAIVTCCF